MKVVCIGSGYVGSVTGTAFAALGYPTTVIDMNHDRIEAIRKGKSPIFEPGLEEWIQKSIGHTLFASTAYEPIRDADVVFIGVGTPSRPDGTADLTFIRLAAEHIGRHLAPDRFTVVVNKSTVPIGTADLVATIIEEISGLREGLDFAVVSNPEFLREGYALEDVFFPDRIVVGTLHPKARDIMKTLYQPVVERHGYEQLSPSFTFPHDLASPPTVYYETDPKSAEMIKYAANAFLAVKISYINEIARLCEALGADVTDVSRGMGLDSRIGGKFLEVSSGWSGSCFPKDTAELLATSQKYRTELSLVKAAVESNQRMHRFVVEKVIRRLRTLTGKQIGILGLTFKPNTDDARKTQASVIIEELLDLGAMVRVHDPQGMRMFKSLHGNLRIDYCQSPFEVAKHADALILLTHWAEYVALDWVYVRQLMKKPYLLDTRNVLDRSFLEEQGFDYEGLGLLPEDHTKTSIQAVSSGEVAVQIRG